MDRQTMFYIYFNDNFLIILNSVHMGVFSFSSVYLGYLLFIDIEIFTNVCILTLEADLFSNGIDR